MNNTRPNFVPVGTIVAYGGEIENKTDELAKKGWLLCEGTELKIEDNVELFEAIEWNWGKPTEETFNLPDFRGLFLRGIDGGSQRDPDVKERIPLAAGGNEKNAVGSYQGYATGTPKNPFVAEIANNNIVTTYFNGGVNTARSAIAGKATTRGNTISGGDLETRPHNKYVYFIIKHSNLTDDNEEVQLPIGSIIPFTGKPNRDVENHYLLCDGDGIQSIGKWKDLFEAIGFAHGKTMEGQFNLPDYRGYFLRGVDGPPTQIFIPRDPDIQNRTSPFPNRPEGSRGNAKDQVGSVQLDATAYPVNGKHFETIIPFLPKEQAKNVISLDSKNIFIWNDKLEKVTLTLSEGSGDTETAPMHFNIDWYIKFTN